MEIAASDSCLAWAGSLVLTLGLLHTDCDLKVWNVLKCYIVRSQQSLIRHALTLSVLKRDMQGKLQESEEDPKLHCMFRNDLWYGEPPFHGHRLMGIFCVTSPWTKSSQPFQK